jgi:hypothetical protein
MTDSFRWDPQLTTARRGRPIYRDPIRAGLTIGAMVTIVGAFLPWAEGHVGLLPKQFGGFDGAADGMIMTGLAIVLLVFARNPEFLVAPDGVRRYTPMLVGIACIALWLLGRQQGEMAIRGWEADSGGGSIATGWWVNGAGVLTMAVVGSFSSLRRRPGDAKVPSPVGRGPRRIDIRSISAAVGATVGTVVGAWFALSTFPPVTVAAPMIFFGAIGLVFGGFAGSSIGRRLVRLLGWR